MITKLVLAAALLALSLALDNYVQVDIEKGTIRGISTSTFLGCEYLSFKGIPYAKPPLGELRFKGPEEESAWVGVLDTVTHRPVCPQLGVLSGGLDGAEDCLFLNVYTPSLEGEYLPVMVWIHEGGFTLGSGNDDLHGPEYFMESGVVLVTMNYRLGALGFLSTEDDGAPGNAGLKDQVAALRWVRRNVARFGGDPENVTIFGESAGGASVQYHTLSPMSSGLFAKAIAQSGSVLNMWALRENPAETMVRLAEGLGAKDLAGNTAKALEFLKSIPHEDIIRMQGTIITPEEARSGLAYLFVPSVERGVKSEEVFLHESPLEILKSGNFSKVPYITGYMSHEGLLLLEDIILPETRKAAIEDTERYVPIDIKNEKLRIKLAKSIRKLYFDDKPIGIENITNLVNLYTDVHFLAGIERSIKLQLKSNNSSVYFYQFSYDGGLNLIKLYFNISLPGAAHGDELGYLFNLKLSFWKRPNFCSDDEYVTQTMIRLWTNFAKCGNPTPPGDSLTWEPVTIDKFNYLHISGRDTRLGQNPDPERSEFWTKAYEEYSAPRLR